MVQIVVDTMTLVVAELPDRVNVFDESAKGFKRTKLVNSIGTVMDRAMMIVKAAPMNGTETPEEVGPSKIRLALTEWLVCCGEFMEWKWARVEDREDTFEEDVTKNGIKVGVAKGRA